MEVDGDDGGQQPNRIELEALHTHRLQRTQQQKIIGQFQELFGDFMGIALNNSALVTGAYADFEKLLRGKTDGVIV